MIYKTIFSRLLLYTLAIAFLVALATYFFPAVSGYQVFTWISLAFFACITGITLYIGLKGLEGSNYGFVASVNGIVLIKLMLSVILVIVYVLIAKPKDPLFILPFFFFYILFTVFEVRQLLIAQKFRSADRKE